MNNWRINYLLVCTLMLPVMLEAQVLRDTSYTIRSAYEKIRKNYPEVTIPVIENGEVSTQKDVVYRQLGNRKLLANLYFVPSADLRPGIVLIHGGGWRSGDRELMQNLALALGNEGYSVMVPEYRMSLEAAFPAAVYDLKAAIRWFREHAEVYKLDKDKLAVMGCSAGGQLASLLGVTGHKEVFYESPDATNVSEVQAIVDVDGVLKFRHPVSTEGKYAAWWLGGKYEEVPENWEQASALNFVDETTPSTLFLASKYPRFLAGHEEYMRLLERFDIKTEKVDMGDAPHSFWLLDPWFEPTVEHTVNFLNDIFEIK